MADDSDDQNFMTRWSRRKADVREQDEVARSTKDEEANSVATVQGQQEGTGEDFVDGDEPDGSELTEEDVEKLTAGDDFTSFMKAAVPAQIRRMALKKLWTLDPAYNLVDGLVEYGEDYSQLHVNVGKIQSAYQVGKGYVLDEEDGEAAEPDESDVVAENSSAPVQEDDVPLEDSEIGVDELRDEDEKAQTDLTEASITDESVAEDTEIDV